MIYLDNAATTRPCAACVEAITTTLTQTWGNPSAQYHFGIEAARLLRASRLCVAEALGAPTESVYFTSGGTEADNWAIFAAAERFGKKNRHIVTTAIEHEAVLAPMKKLETQGYEVTYLQPDALGSITTAQLQAALRPDTFFVSIMTVNNETGAVLPIAQMAKLTHRLCPDALFHTDAVQGFFKVPFSARTLGADLISVSGHKIHAAKGVGALYLGKKLPALLLGGGQESGLRSGTESLPLIAGFAAACAAKKPTLLADIAGQNRLKSLLQARLRGMEGVRFIGAQDAPHIVALAVPGLRSQGLINALYERGFCVSAGSACSKGHRSHVLEAMRLPAAVMDGAIRVSLCDETTEEEIFSFAEALPQVIAALR